MACDGTIVGMNTDGVKISPGHIQLIASLLWMVGGDSPNVSSERTDAGAIGGSRRSYSTGDGIDFEGTIIVNNSDGVAVSYRH